MRDGKRERRTDSVTGRACCDNAGSGSSGNRVLLGTTLASVVGQTTSSAGDGVGERSESARWDHGSLGSNGLSVGSRGQSNNGGDLELHVGGI